MKVTFSLVPLVDLHDTLYPLTLELLRDCDFSAPGVPEYSRYESQRLAKPDSDITFCFWGRQEPGRLASHLHVRFPHDYGG